KLDLCAILSPPKPPMSLRLLTFTLVATTSRKARHPNLLSEKERCHEVAHRLCRLGSGGLDADDGMLLPSLVLSAPLLQPVRHLLLLRPASGLPLRRPVIQNIRHPSVAPVICRSIEARLLIGGRKAP